MSSFVQIDPGAWEGNAFERIGKQWMLICAKQGDKVNLMTASWGGVGVLWGLPVSYAFIRPQRFTRGMVDATDSFSLLFLGEGYRPQLQLCGSQSGRDIDKLEACGFTLQMEGDIPYVSQASDVLFCRKLYAQDLEKACFTLPGLAQKHYPQSDYHRMYVSEISKILVRS